MNLMRSGPTMPNVRVEGDVIYEKEEENRLNEGHADNESRANPYFVSAVADVRPLLVIFHSLIRYD